MSVSIQSLISSPPVRYAIVGLANTAVGYGLIFSTMFAGAGHVAANLIGYAGGFVLSFFANRAWSFRSDAPVSRSLPRFLLVTLVAYLANLTTVVAAVDIAGINPYIAQVSGLGPYVAIAYLGSRYFAFAAHEPRS